MAGGHSLFAALLPAAYSSSLVPSSSPSQPHKTPLSFRLWDAYSRLPSCLSPFAVQRLRCARVTLGCCLSMQRCPRLTATYPCPNQKTPKQISLDEKLQSTIGRKEEQSAADGWETWYRWLRMFYHVIVLISMPASLLLADGSNFHRKCAFTVSLKQSLLYQTCTLESLNDIFRWETNDIVVKCSSPNTSGNQS